MNFGLYIFLIFLHQIFSQYKTSSIQYLRIEKTIITAKQYIPRHYIITQLKVYILFGTRETSLLRPHNAHLNILLLSSSHPVGNHLRRSIEPREANGKGGFGGQSHALLI